MPPAPAVDALPLWHAAEGLLKQNQLDAARDAFAGLVGTGLGIPARLRLSLIASRQGDLREATAQALFAHREDTRDPELLDMLAKRLLVLGETQAFLQCVRALIVAANAPVQALAETGKLAVDAGFLEEGKRLLSRARALGLNTPVLSYLLAIAQLQCGELDAAETNLEAITARHPVFAKAHWALAKLRRQSPGRNHVAMLRRVLATLRTLAHNGKHGEHNDIPLLCYALFKELDDLGEPAEAGAALVEGMAARRRLVAHDARAEAALFDRLRSTCDADFIAGGSGQAPAGPVPIFIIGLPRSGTTLLERILGSHSQIADAGELKDFIAQMRWVANRAGTAQLDSDLLDDVPSLDYALLGRRYLDHAGWRAGGKPYFTDKLPFNFMHAGLIMRALPQAKILHMVREPMDVCFSNLKELFAGAYSYSYDQIEMADHYRQYRQLMTHWHRVAPGRILDVAYTDLVRAPEASARRIFEYCGLPYEPECLAIEARQTPVATASSTQVRQPIHAKALGYWQPYAELLQPLRERLGEYVALEYDPAVGAGAA